MTNTNQLPEQEPKGQWRFETKSYQIADTGDYDGHVEITNGKILLVSKDDPESEAFANLVNALNQIENLYVEDHGKEWQAGFDNGYSIGKLEANLPEDSAQAGKEWTSVDIAPSRMATEYRSKEVELTDGQSIYIAVWDIEPGTWMGHMPWHFKPKYWRYVSDQLPAQQLPPTPHPSPLPEDVEKKFYSREEVISVCEKLRGWIFKNDHDFEQRMNEEIDKLEGAQFQQTDNRKLPIGFTRTQVEGALMEKGLSRETREQIIEDLNNLK